MIPPIAANWHFKNIGGGKYEVADAKKLNVIFGLENPYDRINIVFSYRSKFSDLGKEDGWNLKTAAKNKYLGWNPSTCTFSKKPNDVIVTYYPFLLGIPTDCEVMTAWTNKGSKWNELKIDGKVVVGANATFTSGLLAWIKYNIGWGDSVPANDEGEKNSWIKKLWLYTLTGNDPTNAISAAGKAWLDKHICPWGVRGQAARKNAGKMCRYTLTQENMELFGLMFYSQLEDGATAYYIESKTNNIYPCFITTLYSSKSYCVDYDASRNDSYVWIKRPHDYVTISYYKGGVNTGSLKLITL